MLVRKIYGNVFDLATLMHEAYYISLCQMKNLNLENLTPLEFKNFIFSNFSYKEDTAEQYIKTFKNAVETHYINCKSITVFSKVYLTKKNIKSYFVFWKKNYNYTHVNSGFFYGNEMQVFDLLSEFITYQVKDFQTKYNFTEYLIL